MTKNITTIALVDDHILLRNGLASIVQSFEGYAVLFEANNGKEFIQELKNYSTPDIVLLDINMPEMNGIETAKWMKENIPNSRILVLSVMDTDTVIISMLKHGARGYILKDSKPGVFKQALDNVRDSGFFMNELVSNKMLNYVTHEEGNGKGASVISQLTENETIFLQLSCTELTYKEIGKKRISPRIRWIS
jgi:DNA-binding NarL/FixJ family response regulator